MSAGRKNQQQRRYGRRPFATRTPLPVVTVVCDDTKTAVAYFTEWKREVKATITVKVEPSPCCGATPNDLVEHALKFVPSPDPQDDERVEGDSTWLLLDTESEEYKQEQAQDAKRQADERQIHVLLSKPCYEVWTLAHFIDTGEAFQDCKSVLTRLKTEWKKKFGIEFGAKKGQADYSKLIPLQSEAVKNAKNRAPDRDQSWTEVYKIIEAIEALRTRGT
jgi:hypothetical protein